MKRPRLRTLLLIPVFLLAAFYTFGVIINLTDKREVAPLRAVPEGSLESIALFGASGTAGDGILKAALADPDVGTIHVITRRSTPRIEEGVRRGKVVMTTHLDYLDYTPVIDQLADVQAVYWAIGTSIRNVDNETYSVIHIDFPVSFVEQWLPASRRPEIAFHYISSSDISEDSSMHWAREKYRAELELFALAEGTKLEVIAWRPDYIGPTEEEAHLGQDLLYWFFAPLGVAVRAQQIGEAMLEVTVREDEFKNGDKLANRRILRYSKAYQQRIRARPAAVHGTGQPQASGHGASEALDALIERYVEAQRSDDAAGDLRAVTAESFVNEIEASRDLLQAVRAVDPAELGLEEGIDRKLLIGLLESDIYSAEQRRVWENDASLYVPAYQLGRLLDPEATGPAPERAGQAKELLAQIPGRLATARENLLNPPRRLTEAAIFRTRGTIESIEEGSGALAKVADEEFVRTVDEALVALRVFETFLQEELLPRSTGSWAAGKEYYDYILQHRWFLDADPDEILARGQSAFVETEALAQEVSERIDPGKHWSEVYEKLKDQHPPADGIKAAYQASIDAARDFVIEHQIVTLPEGERVITVDTPPAMRRSSPFGTFQSVDPFGEGLEGRLVLTPIEDWMTPEQQAGRLRSHHDAWIPIIAVHEAYPGHHVAALKTRENPRLLRKVVQEPIFSEGWGLLTEELMFDEGFLVGDDVRLTQLRNRLWRAARVILDVSLHTERMTFEEAVDFLAERVRFERYAAELEVGMYTVRPTYVLGYLIGMQEIMSIRDEWVETFGEPTPPSRFYDALLTVGTIPPVLVRESLFGAQSGE